MVSGVSSPGARRVVFSTLAEALRTAADEMQRSSVLFMSRVLFCGCAVDVFCSQCGLDAIRFLWEKKNSRCEKNFCRGEKIFSRGESFRSDCVLHEGCGDDVSGALLTFAVALMFNFRFCADAVVLSLQRYRFIFVRVCCSGQKVYEGVCCGVF